MPFWQAFLVAAVLLHSVNAKNIFSRSREGLGPGALGKEVPDLLVVCCDAIAVFDADQLKRTR